jgi:Do/DeqQ family serine protease
MADFSKIAGQAVKGVANISSLQVVRTSNSPFGSDPFFRYFFGDDDPFNSRDRRAQSLGSGVIVSPDGYLLTNNHVVGDVSAQVSVVLGDKREMPAKIVGVDEMTDLAVLKIDARGLPALPWGDSSKLKVAEWVLAIGNPFQLSGTVTLGIVSTVRRRAEQVGAYQDFIQTDAAINPGNSGGALVNARGELVGINTAIYSESGGYQGIGFAVPSNLAKRIVTDLMKNGEVRRGSIGPLTLEKLTEQLAAEVGARTTNGALISRMYPQSEAYGVGLRPGDVIIAFNGQPVDDPSQFARFVADAKIGSTATVRVAREGRTLDFDVASKRNVKHVYKKGGSFTVVAKGAGKTPCEGMGQMPLIVQGPPPPPKPAVRPPGVLSRPLPR